jgi:hypothetical protein
LNVRPQLPAVDGQVDVGVVVVGGDDDRRGRFDAGPVERVDVGAASQDEAVVLFDQAPVSFDDPVGDALRLEGFRGGRPTRPPPRISTGP